MSNNYNVEFETLIKTIESYNPSGVAPIRKAWAFAQDVHAGKIRLSGDPEITHPLEVAKILANWQLDTATVVSGLLHETIEEGGVTKEDISKIAGGEVAEIIGGVWKVTELRLRGSREEVFVESLRKLILVMAKDLRVVFVKLADRIHNMQTLYALSPEKQKMNSLETLDLYAPLAERLGVGRAKSLLEDLAFPYAYKNDYERVVREAKPYFEKAERHIGIMKSKIQKKLDKENIKGEIHGRKKHLYSLWRKLERPEIDWDFAKINDIVALRVLVNTREECYITLGIVHSLFKPVPKIGISDFIAQPKPNGYQSIHTKVFGPDGRIAEVQIRTFEMHEGAEKGVAAHWAYSELKTKQSPNKVLSKNRVPDGTLKFAWVKELLKWHEEIKDSRELLNSLKFDLFSKRNFVFSPMGDVYDLPELATPVDFAYAIHTHLGNSISGAKVNNKIVPLSYHLKSGDVVEIIKSKYERGPNRDWLKSVATTTAKREINKYLRKRDQ